jgi:dephospho-CoA kinase (EC 2.7.1.24)
MLTIGLTGGIGSGKSSVSQWFKEKGIPVMDADKIVHSLLDGDQEAIAELVAEFGTEILDVSGEKINRRVLGGKVFGDEQARRRLEQIIQPRVNSIMKQKRANLEKQGFTLCVWDAPLLFEGGRRKDVDQVWVVWVPQEIQIERVFGRDKLTKNEILDRILAQMPLDEKIKLSDVVVDNSGSWEQTLAQLEDYYKEFLIFEHVNPNPAPINQSLGKG